MNKRCTALTILVALVLLASVSLTGTAFAQDQQVRPPHAMFAHPAPHPAADSGTPGVTLTTFKHTYNFVGDGGNRSITIVGTDPSTTNTTTTIPVVIIPINFVITKGSTSHSFNPATKKLANGKTVIQNTMNSPIFRNGIDFVQGGTDLGNTQYEDAYERGNFWTNVMTNTSYHLLLGRPTVTATQTLTVPAGSGTIIKNPFGAGQVGNVDINYFDGQIQPMFAALGITANELPIFEYYDVYLTEGGCCIGGYHNAIGIAQTYATFDYEDAVGSFSQDVSALTHEIGEWILDPFVNNTGCGGLLENGDPLENEANFGAVPYTLNGFTYNLQDLVFLKYFGQSPATSVNGWETLQGTTLSTCQNGQ